MPLVRMIRDGVFIEADVRVNIDDTPEVSEDMAKLLYSRNWAVPYFKEDDLIIEVEHNEEPAEESAENESEQTDAAVALRPARRR